MLSPVDTTIISSYVQGFTCGRKITAPHNSVFRQVCFKTQSDLWDPGQGAIGSIGALLVREPPAAKAVHGVGGDGVAKLLKGVIPVAALLDLVEQFGQLTRHCVI